MNLIVIKIIAKEIRKFEKILILYYDKENNREEKKDRDGRNKYIFLEV